MDIIQGRRIKAGRNDHALYMTNKILLIYVFFGAVHVASCKNV